MYYFMPTTKTKYFILAFEDVLFYADDKGQYIVMYLQQNIVYDID